MKKSLTTLALASFVYSSCSGIIVNVDANDDGFSNAPFTNPNFWGVDFISDSVGGLHITEFSVDLRASGQNLSGVFDLVGGVAPFGPVVGSATSGLLAGDVTFSPNSGTGFSVLTLTFAPGSFTEGDTIRFGADLDNMDLSDLTADSLGPTGVGFEITFSDGSLQTGVFVDDGLANGYSSSAVVPEPSTFALLAGSLGLAWVLIRRRWG